MIDMLITHGILSSYGLCAIFTSNMMQSLKTNIIDHHGDEIFGLKEDQDHSDKGKYKKYITFLKDLLIWIFMMFLAYIIYKKFSKGNSSIINNN
jgi:hypothetical protein